LHNNKDHQLIFVSRLKQA